MDALQTWRSSRSGIGKSVEMCREVNTRSPQKKPDSLWSTAVQSPKEECAAQYRASLEGKNGSNELLGHARLSELLSSMSKSLCLPFPHPREEIDGSLLEIDKASRRAALVSLMRTTYPMVSA